MLINLLTYCPYCGGTDLDEFEDGTGAMCLTCLSNVYDDDEASNTSEQSATAADPV